MKDKKFIVVVGVCNRHEVALKLYVEIHCESAEFAKQIFQNDYTKRDIADLMVEKGLKAVIEYFVVLEVGEIS